MSICALAPPFILSSGLFFPLLCKEGFPAPGCGSGAAVVDAYHLFLYNFLQALCVTHPEGDNKGNACDISPHGGFRPGDLLERNRDDLQVNSMC